MRLDNTVNRILLSHFKWHRFIPSQDPMPQVGRGCTREIEELSENGDKK